MRIDDEDDVQADPEFTGRPVRGAAIPAEGEGGLFSQSWFPICLSSEVAGTSAVRGFDFLDGRVIVLRDAAGTAHVLSAYCPHLGADLGVGEVVGDTVRCAFHHWKFDKAGRCIETAVGDRPPRAARLFRFPTEEKFGIVWAFNGTEPRWPLPDFPFAATELTMKSLKFPQTLPVDPWVLCANTPDMQHIKALHGVTFDGADPHELVDWTDHSLHYDFAGVHRRGERIENRIGIYGTSLYYQSTRIDGRWFGFLAPFGMPRPGTAQTYMVVAARTDSGTREEVDAFLDSIVELESRVVGEDVAVMQTIKFRPGTLTKSDRTLARFFTYMRRYPRAHPSAGYIN